MEMDLIQIGYTIGLLIFILSIISMGIRIVRPIERGLIERLGKYRKFASPGFKYIIPFVDRLIKVNTTEQMVDIESQQIITNDNLNATVAAQVYFKIKPEEENVKNSQYKVDNVDKQIVALAQTTLRNIIGTLTLNDANTKRDKINIDLMKTLSTETEHWGIQVVRTELREIDPPSDVQDTMNRVVKAENEKVAAKDFASAAETEADGRRRAAIKEAEGNKRALVLEAEGKKQATVLDGQGRAERIKLVYESSQKHFKGDAQVLRKLETVENSLKSNSVIVLPEGESLINVIGNMAGTPIITKSKDSRITKTKPIEEKKKQKKRRLI